MSKEISLTISEASREWRVFTDNKTFSVLVRAWYSDSSVHFDGPWRWNVYAVIFEDHPLFSSPEKALEVLQFHGGANYDKRITTDEARGNQYNHQRSFVSLKIGCDYNHLHDEYFCQSNPKDGIPWAIQEDCLELANQLWGYLEQ